MNAKSVIKKSISHRCFPALFLLILGLVAYGRLVVQAGIFGDDPQMLYAFHRYGLAGYKHALGWSRPFGIWVYAPLHILFDSHPALWQMGAILLRTLSAWLLFLLLWRIKKEWRVPALFAAAACLLYPGFSQQAHALQFSLHWAALSAGLASQILMLRVLEESSSSRRWALNISSWLLAALGIFTTEYFIGLELLRFFALCIYLADMQDGVSLQQSSRNILRKHVFLSALSRWLPYLGLVLVFSGWRVFAAEINYPSPLLLDDFTADPGTALSALLERIPNDLWQSAVLAWKSAILHTSDHMDLWLYLCLGAAISFILWAFFHNLPMESTKTSAKNAGIIIACGLVLALFGGVPLWISKTPLALSFPENRATLCLAVGICLVLGGVSDLARQAGRLMAAVLLGFALIFQLDTCLDYADSWKQLQIFFQQLTTCAPGLEQGTALLYEEPFIQSYPANSLSALLNWSYDPDNHGEQVSYDMLRISERLGNSIPILKPGLPIQHGAFQGSTSRVLVVALDEQGCPYFLYPDDASTPLLWQASLIANPDVITQNPGQPARLPSFFPDPPLNVDCSCD